ncbi:uncharacterized protein NESG_00814 [Nematocida ausubeli]|uniref:Uncharacterized protein n=1 Tax=Nematocida ausubeli (strain ATCC PRA-371 / ERTm2) TaxID=1913371 RepID=A0A086J3E5_NEMA1|nr:uncharacterized protein NESG_00814 [Nematocida ausubeli]KFG26663.1 hypothetical protein NESG_00814 [Nematocida ausubeli]
MSDKRSNNIILEEIPKEAIEALGYSEILWGKREKGEYCKFDNYINMKNLEENKMRQFCLNGKVFKVDIDVDGVLKKYKSMYANNNANVVIGKFGEYYILKKIFSQSIIIQSGSNATQQELCLIYSLVGLLVADTIINNKKNNPNVLKLRNVIYNRFSRSSNPPTDEEKNEIIRSNLTHTEFPNNKNGLLDEILEGLSISLDSRADVEYIPGYTSLSNMHMYNYMGFLSLVDNSELKRSLEHFCTVGIEAQDDADVDTYTLDELYTERNENGVSLVEKGLQIINENSSTIIVSKNNNIRDNLGISDSDMKIVRSIHKHLDKILQERILYFNLLSWHIPKKSNNSKRLDSIYYGEIKAGNRTSIKDFKCRVNFQLLFNIWSPDHIDMQEKSMSKMTELYAKIEEVEDKINQEKEESEKQRYMKKLDSLSYKCAEAKDAYICFGILRELTDAQKELIVSRIEEYAELLEITLKKGKLHRESEARKFWIKAAKVAISAILTIAVLGGIAFLVVLALKTSIEQENL